MRRMTQLGWASAVLLLGTCLIVADEEPKPGPKPPAVRPGNGPLAAKKHWSTKPGLLPGAELLATHFVKFQTPDGRTISAKLFLTAVNPSRAGNPKAAGLPVRFFATGFEIATDQDFEPDFVVDAKFVKELFPGGYELDLGSVKYRVTATAAAGPEKST